ncbi:LacI family transcriptional regulator [Kitasatospora sp. RB6PN24]|uniref:LacI family DNA-binding transcriptional regulator n=1 Tax=Kitasatospora humi TaxID=2893891 RepID=UPI001E373546|nr:LacI family DNA-binding transcriptional regulator [Kitasatospora humi]MCC9312263.1 LacI family transcriptional regulator [Kitasatospora humi]
MAVSAEVRRAWLTNAVRESGTVRVMELARQLGIPAVTLRRDIAALARQGLLRRSHGAVSLAEEAGPTDSDSRMGVPPAGGRGRMLGMLVPTIGSYFDEVIAGARAAAVTAGARLVLGIAAYQARDDRVQVERMLESAVEGLLLTPNWGPEGRDEDFDWLDDLPVPAVLVERRAAPGGPGATLDAVGTDHRHGVLLALRHLASLGHRSVALSARTDTSTSHQVRVGYAEAVRLLGLEPQPLIELDSSGPGGVKALADRIADGAAAGVRAALVHNDHTAIQLPPLLRARGLTVPDDLALISYDDVYAALAAPALTAVAPPKRAVGAAAADLLLRRLDGGADLPVRRIELLPGLKIRGSCGA